MQASWAVPAMAFIGGILLTHYFERAFRKLDEKLTFAIRTRAARQAYELSYRAFAFDPEDLLFLCIRRWNIRSMPAESENIGPTRVSTTRARPQDWVDSQEIDRARHQLRERHVGNPCASLVTYQIDDRESEDTTKFFLTVQEGHYSDYVAVRDYFGNPEHLNELQMVYQRVKLNGIRSVAESAPMSDIVINASVLTYQAMY
ncbi:hypothetical protein ACFQX7_30910 [Luedemannella flava]